MCKNVYGNELNITTRARKITKEDFYNFEYIFCMDKKNLKDIISFKNKYQINNSKAKIQRLGDLLNDEEDIEDPYCRDIVLFENVFKQVEKSLEVFFENFDKKKKRKKKKKLKKNKKKMPKILFVCLGNICRSPMYLSFHFIWK